MSPQTAFKFYWGIHLHFSTVEYSLPKYGTNTVAAQSKYDSLSNEQKYKFLWLAEKFPITQNLVYACIGAEFSEVSIQFGTKEDIIESYFKFKSRRESISYVLQSEITKHELDNNIILDKLIFKYLVGNYSPEYVLLLAHNTDKLDKLYQSPNISWAKEKILKLIKYKDFFNSQKYIHLIENHEHV